MVDAADYDKFDASKNELHNLLDKPQLSGIPVRIIMCHICDLFNYVKYVTYHHESLFWVIYADVVN